MAKEKKAKLSGREGKKEGRRAVQVKVVIDNFKWESIAGGGCLIATLSHSHNTICEDAKRHILWHVIGYIHQKSTVL